MSRTFNPRLEEELGGNVVFFFFRDLRLIEGNAVVFEIGARVLQVRVEKQAIESDRRCCNGGSRLRPCPREGYCCQRAGERTTAMSSASRSPRPAPVRLRFFDGNVQKFGDRALVDDDTAIHISFAQPELRVQEDAPLRPLGSQTEWQRACQCHPPQLKLDPAAVVT